MIHLREVRQIFVDSFTTGQRILLSASFFNSSMIYQQVLRGEIGDRCANYHNGPITEVLMEKRTDKKSVEGSSCLKMLLVIFS